MQFYLGRDPTTVEISNSFSIAHNESVSYLLEEQLWSNNQGS